MAAPISAEAASAEAAPSGACSRELSVEVKIEYFKGIARWSG
ncbi:hypothetical protein [Hyphomicrobium sp. DY-1]